MCMTFKSTLSSTIHFAWSREQSPMAQADQDFTGRTCLKFFLSGYNDIMMFRTFNWHGEIHILPSSYLHFFNYNKLCFSGLYFHCNVCEEVISWTADDSLCNSKYPPSFFFDLGLAYVSKVSLQFRYFEMHGKKIL